MRQPPAGATRTRPLSLGRHSADPSLRSTLRFSQSLGEHIKPYIPGGSPGLSCPGPRSARSNRARGDAMRDRGRN
eukprot:scaffold90254_cov60-Phaeocystis_antarctica.AAC.1